MQECPKCSSQYGDESKICRTCGAILEAVAEDSPQANDLPPREDEDAHESLVTEKHSWTCSQCSESVPETFEVCWNCGTSKDGIPDLDFNKEPTVAKEHPGPQVALEQAAGKRACPRCGSSKIIPDTRILDSSSYSHHLQVMVDADPDALVFKDRRYAQVNASICGNCGHVELKVEHPRELYEHYLRSQSQPGA